MKKEVIKNKNKQEIKIYLDMTRLIYKTEFMEKRKHLLNQRQLLPVFQQLQVQEEEELD